ncbi:hypothetical protein CCR85_03625 [Rhodothalassium salexigens]|uniref:prenyltransferase n=1 Tax=Rhodothalassium salexigens TaxID=1086 RepID=UPI0019122894|nr:prenyltransferase [Rhodothalassium salexigens]MBK5910581.1 hypothetical protein [Rhodothalassium salexigens]
MTSRSATLPSRPDRRDQHGQDSQGGPNPVTGLARYWHATRPQFLTASVVPVVVGTAWGAATAGRFDPLAALLFLIGMMLGHAAGNVINDVCDDISGNDALNDGRITPFTGGSRIIQNGTLSRRAMTWFGAALLAGPALTALYLVPAFGLPVLVFGLVMAVLVLAYHLPPVKLNHRCLGETVIGLTFGVLPVTMAGWLQAGTWDAGLLVLSLAVALWIANLLLVNEVPDRRADALVAKTTLVVALGARRALILHAGLSLTALALVVWLAGPAGLLPWWGAVVPALLTAVAVAAVLRAGPDDRAAMTGAIKATITLHTLASLWLALALIWGS